MKYLIQYVESPIKTRTLKTMAIEAESREAAIEQFEEIHGWGFEDITESKDAFSDVVWSLSSPSERKECV